MNGSLDFDESGLDASGDVTGIVVADDGSDEEERKGTREGESRRREQTGTARRDDLARGSK